jgi:chemosensory pili system protein ChpA (sensor histidine kinase/response regulator)
MTGYTLNDVRDSFVTDMTGCLAQIEGSTHEIEQAIAGTDELVQATRKEADLIGVTLHAIAGTSSLVAIESMHGAARRLEDLGPEAGESLRMVALHVGRLRSIAALWAEGGRALRAMLELELAERSSEALAAQRAFLARVQTGPDGTGLAPVGGAPAVAAAPAAPPPAPRPIVIPPGMDPELLEVFRDEAREVAEGLRGHLAALEARPDDLATTNAASRLLHLLKGAAASVQLAGLTESVTWLYRRFEDLLARAAPVDRDTLDRLRAGIAEVTAFTDPAAAPAATAAAPAVPAQVAPARAAAPAAPPELGPPSQLSYMEDDESPLAVFREEAARILGTAESLIRRLRAANAGAGESRGDLADQLERLFHRLKGSALVVGEEGIAAWAAEAQGVCERGAEGAAAEELTRAIEAIRDDLPGGPLAPESDAMTPPPRAVAPAAASPSPPSPPPPSSQPPSAAPASGGRVHVDRELWDTFVGEAGDLLDQIDRLLNALERSSDPRGVLRSMLRHYHTLKGAANAAGLASMGRSIHTIESYLERLVVLRVIPPLGGAVSAFAEVQRRLRRSLARAEQGVVESDSDHLDRLLSSATSSSVSSGSWLGSNDPAWSPRTGEERDGRSESWRRGSGAPESGTGSELGEQDRRFIRVPVDRLDGLMNMVGELVVNRSRMVSRLDKLRGLHDDGDTLRRQMIDAVETFATQGEFANLDGRRARRARQVRAARVAQAASVAGFGELELDTYEEIHVLSRRLLETASDVSQTSTDINSELASLVDDAEAISGIVSGLQNEITRARMVPLETLFSRLYMPVRDAAQRERKSADLVARGEAVSIDKAIADALYGPMLHLVRNAVAHGIEPEDVRRRAGKNPRGSIGVAARQESGHIVIEVSDDGGGIDTARLRELGVAHGLVPPTIAPDDPALLQLVFAPGISTSDSVGDVAGRGVGGDVARRAVERLNGTITVSSSRGVGTMFTITLPLTTSITQAIMVRDGARVFAIPMHFTERILELDRDQLVESLGRRRINIDGEILPLRSAADLFGDRERSADERATVVVCALGEHALALEIDAVISQEEIVVKPLGAVLENHALFSGVTLRGDGQLALILDIPGILGAMAERAPAAGRAVGAVSPDARPARAPELELPAAAEPAAPPSSESESESEVIRVLFVDDSLSVRKVAEKALTSLGVEVVTAVDGQDALDRLRTGKFSIVFTDLEMPRVHGYDLIRQLRFVPAYQTVPVIVISSRSGTKHVEHALSMGANEYLTKPFTAEDLDRMISRWVRGEREGN